MNIRDYLKEHIVLLDGGMGTLLQESGLQPGELPERWNLSNPNTIIGIHKAYYEAGSNIVATNTFGANLLKYEDEELQEIIHAAVDNARIARTISEGQQEKYISLDVGPIGKLLEPYGDLAFEEAVRIYRRTIEIGASFGVDLIYIETMNDSLDTKAALLAAKEACDLPVFVSNAYGADGKLMTGATPLAMIAMLEGMGADAIGANCSLGPAQLQGVVEDYLTYASVPVLLKPNAGLPRSENGKTVYDIDPAAFADLMRTYVADGVRIAGGCCGTRPEYIRLLSEKTCDLVPHPITDKDLTVISSYTHAVLFGRKPILIGERINPTGKKRFKEALRNNDIDYILGEGLKQEENGADVLDVNVGLPEIDEVAMIRNVTYELQSVTDLPLQIDTTDAEAMEAALRSYNGKPMINSVNGKQEIMKQIFPLAKKYGGLLVCLTLDEDGIPETAEKRVKIARRIIETAASYGIAKKDLIFDPLTMAVSADPHAALTTLEALRRIHTELGCHTTLGVSNVSFGLPSREIVTANFFALALENGLSAAILNPNSAEMRKTYYAYNVLHGLDANCLEYINRIADCVSSIPDTLSPQKSGGQQMMPELAASKDASTKDASMEEQLQAAIIRGLKERAAGLTEELLQDHAPLDIVNRQIIPALDIVGQGFEQKTMYLPQLLMSAEASQQAFEVIKNRMQDEPDSMKVSRGKFVIATVKGDIHDIGKNIVKLILENYGFEVIDLGKDVAPETIVDATIEHHALLVGLSALMTTTVPAMEETIRQIRDKAPWAKVCVGGAVLTQEYADRIGADFYGKDAMATVRYAVEQAERIDNE